MDDKDKIIGNNDSMINIDYIGSGAAQPTLAFDYSDTIVLDTTHYDTSGSITSPCTITLPSYNSNFNYSNTYTTTSTGGSNYTLGGGMFSDGKVHIDTDGINVKEDGDIKIGKQSLKEFMTKMEQRLAILVPDPAKLEKFEALKKAYEHYKTMESLCFDEPEEDENK